MRTDKEQAEPEKDRIQTAYRKLEERRQMQDGEFSGGLFVFENLAHVLRIHERHRMTLSLLRNGGIASLGSLRILDVGCGDGNMLRQFVQWGALPQLMAGIDIRDDVIARARERSPLMEMRAGSATGMPWPDGQFDLVCQHTVFTSILDAPIRRQVAAEMRRVLKPGGSVLWYDFRYDNPRNPDVRGVRENEIRELFAGYNIRLCSLTLLPPLARRLPDNVAPALYPVLSSLPFLRTHLLGLFRKPMGQRT